MNQTQRRRVVVSLLLGQAVLAAVARAQGVANGFEEVFGLAPDRKAALAQLLPGTEDDYYYRCLDAQHRGQLEAVPALLGAWIQRHGRSVRVEVIENRQALLGYTKDPAATLRYLRDRLGVRLSAEREVAGAKLQRPTQVDPALLDPARLNARALASRPGTVEGFRPAGLALAAAMPLDKDQLASLVKNVRRPDLPNLVPLLARYLREVSPVRAADLAVYDILLLDQLEQLAQQVPGLLQIDRFVRAYALRLAPSADVDWRRDPTERAAWLERLWSFAQRLPASQSGFKVHVLHQRLQHDLAAGQLDRERFLTYLRLPRPADYASERLRQGWGQAPQQFGDSVDVGLPAVTSDRELVRALLGHFLVREDSYEPWAALLDEAWVRSVFAEIKLLAGLGDAEKLYALVGSPADYERLKERVDLEFAPTQPRHYAADAPVTLEVDVKNVPTLLVKVFAIDAYAYLRDTGKDVDATIPLDGLVANFETAHQFAEPPLRRVRRRFELPELTAPGTYVVELVGNGVSSRAVIQKGSLHFTLRPGAAGQVLTVRDAAGQAVPGATAWFAGQEFTADARGEVNLPYGAAGPQPLLLRAGNVATLTRVAQQAETYALGARVLVERQSLLPGYPATLLLRPELLLNGAAISLSLLEQPELEIAAEDRRGVPSVRTVRDLKLVAGEELAQTIQVPEGLAKLKVVLRGRVQNLTDRKPVELVSTPAEFAFNRIDATAETAAPLLGRDGEGYWIDVLGRNGEPKVGRALTVRLELRHYVGPVDVECQTDARGRVQLGRLDGVERVRVLGLPSDPGGWPLEREQASAPAALSGVAGEPLRVPYAASSDSAAPVKLLEKRGRAWVRDLSELATVRDGYVELRDLPAGDFDLWLPALGAHVSVQITAGTVRDGWAFGRQRWLPVAPPPPAQIQALAMEGDDVVVRVANAGRATRVHVFATRYELSESPLRLEGQARDGRQGVSVEPRAADYQAGRQLGDEYRYVLDRRFAKKYAGNMLKRPGLLLNPWAVDATRAESERALGGGDAFKSESWNSSAGLGGGAGGRYGGRGVNPGTFANVDFLPAPAGLRSNLRPDAAGLVRVPRSALGAGQILHAVVVDGTEVAYRSLALAEQPLAPRPRQLQVSFDAAQHFAEHARIEFVDGGGRAVIDASASAQVQTFASLADVFRLFTAASGNTELATFGFLLRWPTLSDVEKRETYGKHACHELHFFLHQKDRAFFDAVVRPYLANKLHPTFLDHWLLDADLSAYVAPWAFARLNVVEQILLLQRLPGEREAAARLLREKVELLPRDPERARRLFEVALRSAGLEELQQLRTLAAVEPAPEPAAKAKDAKPARPGGGRGAGGPASPGPAAPAPRERAAAKKAVEEAEKDDLAGAVADGAELRAVRRFEANDEEGDKLLRETVRELYRAPEPTQRFVEHGYWHRKLADSDADMIAVNEFWRDYAANPLGTPFRSPSFAAATSSVAEMLLALAVLDLPFAADVPALVRDGDSLTLRPATPLLLVRQEVKPATPATRPGEVLLAQSFFRLDDRYREEAGERVDRFVTGEFVVDVAYGAQVVLTNPTSTPRKLDLLLQIPQGAVPLQGGLATRGMPVALEPFGTAKLEYTFYFPAPGEFAHYPAHASKDGALVAAAALTQPKLQVVAAPSAVDTTSWEHVSQSGTLDEVVAFLERSNLQQVDLGRIQWRLRDAAAYARLATLLKARHVWHAPSFAYALLHGDVATAREYLQAADGFVAKCGPALRSPLLDIDPVARGAWQHVEFEPLFNARAHQRGKPTILNRDLAAQYRAFVDVLCHEPQPNSGQLLLATYYLLLQDRIDDALTTFARVDQKSVATQLQVDYLRCYLAFFSEDRATARALATKYAAHPVARWRNLFGDVLAQLDEAEGKAPGGGDLADRTQRLNELAATAPQLDVQVDGGRVLIRHKNVASCEVRWFRTDVEFAFSTSPFVAQGAQSIAWVKPQRADTVRLAASASETAVELPADLRNQNLLVEVRAQGLVRRAPAFASALAVQTVESYGQLQVTHATTKQPLSKVYVKVYARGTGGAVRFYKDGYTDLRGRFDYASVSGPSSPVERFALLVLSETDGAVVREVAPPGK